MTIHEVMHDDHGRCDELFARAEEAIGAGDLAAGAKAFAAFSTALDRHLAMEEELLFPALEARSGGPMGPTQVMRFEHAQMREAVAAMGEALGEKDAPGFLGRAETLLIVMQQHNFKEERILYPMMDRALASESDALVAKVKAGLA